jgi:hypothetical protein
MATSGCSYARPNNSLRAPSAGLLAATGEPRCRRHEWHELQIRVCGD